MLATVLLALGPLGGCTRDRAGPRPPAPPSSSADRPATDDDSPGTPRVFEPLPGLPVRDLWYGRPRGTGDARTRALENLGPDEPLGAAPSTAHTSPTARDGATGAHAFANANAVYWTDLVGLPFREDVTLDLDHEPVDLDGDGQPDTTVTRHLHAPGGILANPALFGLVATPDDPAGTRGQVSVSTGVLGLREALDEEGRPSGKVGMTCFLCHGASNPTDGRVTLGLANTHFDYGLLLATARVLSDEPDAVAIRRARGFPDGRTVRARLLLAGPGRQDLTGEFGLDVTVPGYRSAVYRGSARVRQGTRGLVNPLSVPSALGVDGLELQNWSGSEIASERWVSRLISAEGSPRPDVLRAFHLPDGDASLTRRALLLDLRNLGTLGLQQDSWPGLLFADALYGLARVPQGELLRLHALYVAADVRETLLQEGNALRRPAGEPQAVARGRRLFFDQRAGVVANLRILKEPPPAYAASRIETPVLAPLFAGRKLGERLAVRCGDCHNASPRDTKQDFATNPSPSARCTSCHRAHSAEEGVPPELDVFLDRRAEDEARFCRDCHEQHRTFAPVSYSSSALLPFDADRDGRAQEDDADDARAGGIGTESLLAFDIPRPEWGPDGFHLPVAIIDDVKHPGPVTTAALGAAWVRVPPLTGVFASAPYLHNGSVPTLEALLLPPAQRPRTFALGPTGFVLDTQLAGNRAWGHDFGTRWSARQKADVVAFLRSL